MKRIKRSVLKSLLALSVGGSALLLSAPGCDSVASVLEIGGKSEQRSLLLPMPDVRPPRPGLILDMPCGDC